MNERVMGLLSGSEILAARLHRPLRPRLLMAEVLGTERAPFLICSVTHLSSSSSSASCFPQTSSVTGLRVTGDHLTARRGWQPSLHVGSGAAQQSHHQAALV